ncbi:MAG: hypothetical protein D6706_01075 [Chloroflexi bacterium]|nr:MAG: hypothetical protein D6706_01075 [Chloroflexota bacterium]
MKNNTIQEEALRDLQSIREMMQKTRHAINAAGTGQIMVLWGVVWLLGFGGSQFLEPSAAGTLWMVLDIAGAVGSMWFGARLGRKVQSYPGYRIGLWWLALLVYAGLIGWLVGIESQVEFDLFITLFVGLGYVLSGILLSRIVTWVGLGLTAVAILGYFLLPDWFSLWMAILGGGTLIGTGLWIIRHWR